MVTRKQKRWARRYLFRIRAGLEHCRNCGVREGLTWGHLIPKSHGGPFTIDNITILCGPCNRQQSDKIWPHLRSLIEEERDNPPSWQTRHPGAEFLTLAERIALQGRPPS